MIDYKKGVNCSIEEIYKAFKLGFSDYVIQLDMSLEAFQDRFFGPEGNQIDLTHVAFADGSPIGVLLGGIRQWDGLKSLRCGGLAVAPDFRGQGVSQVLLQKHLDDAKANQCDRMTLEVLKGNDRAIAFYKKHHYCTTYDLKYYALPFEALDVLEVEGVEARRVNDGEGVVAQYELECIDWQRFLEHRLEKQDLHLPWQGEVDYFQGDETTQYKQIWQGKIPLGFVAYSAKGKLHWLWIRPAYRGRGIGTWVLQTLAKSLPEVKQFSMSFTNHGALEGYFRKLGAVKADVEQFEMVRV